MYRNHQRTLPMDGQRLKELLKKRGISQVEISKSAGYARSWIQNAIGRDYVTPPMLVVLEKYNIHYDDIKPLPKPLPKATAPKGDQTQEENGGVVYVREMTQGDLYETIYDAVRDALNGGKDNG